MRRFAGRRAVFLRVMAVCLITATTLVFLGAFLSGVEVTSFGAALIAAALIGLFNALVWPLLFVLVPRDWTLPKEPIIGAEAMHLQMRRWLADLGHEACREGA